MQAVAKPDHVPQHLVVDFDMYAQPEIGADFHGAWRSLKDLGEPVLWTPRNEGHWLVTERALFEEIYDNWGTFSNEIIVMPKSHGDAHDLLPTTIDPPEHQPYRMVLNKLLAPAEMAKLETSIRDGARGLIESFKDQGKCEFNEAFARAMPLHVFMTLMDLPREDIPQLKYWSDQVTHPDGSMTFPEALAKISDYLRPYIEDRRAAPADDFISHLVNAQIDERRVDDDEARKLSVQLLIAGVDTVVNFLAFAFLKLARDPELQRKIAADPESAKDYAESLFSELPLVTIGRLVTEDREFHGVTLKKGDMIALPTPLSAPGNGERGHLTFGRGPHMCPGRHLARLEATIVLQEWFRAIPEFALAPDATLHFGGGLVGNIDALELVWPV